MKKFFKFFLKVCVFLIVVFLILFILFFEELYKSRYSSCNSNAKVVFNVVTSRLNGEKMSLINENAIVYGRIDHNMMYIDSICNEKKTLEFDIDSDLGFYYWAASVEKNEVQSVWICAKDILKDELLVPYEYGDQKNYISVYGNQFIGYYSN